MASLDQRDGGAEAVRLIEYSIVSVRRGAEHVLPGAGDRQVVLTEPLDGEDFAIWAIAHYLQTAGHRRLPPGEAASLRVTSRVLARWPRQPLDYETRQLHTLHGIAAAVRACCGALPWQQPLRKRVPDRDTPPLPRLAAASPRAPGRRY